MNTEVILNELAKAGYDIRKTAAKLQVTQVAVQEAIRIGREKPAQPATGGPAHLQPYLIATKPAGEAWQRQDDQAIRAARRQHNAGTHTLMSGTADGWTRLYLVPLRTPVPPRETFSEEQL